MSVAANPCSSRATRPGGGSILRSGGRGSFVGDGFWSSRCAIGAVVYKYDLDAASGLTVTRRSHGSERDSKESRELHSGSAVDVDERRSAGSVQHVISIPIPYEYKTFSDPFIAGSLPGQLFLAAEYRRHKKLADSCYRRDIAAHIAFE